MTGRITKRFAALRTENRTAFIPFITAGDPDPEVSYSLFERLPEAGADLIELGIPFTDPMADGPAIQQSSLRALEKGMTLAKVLAMVTRFRKKDAETPVVLMGYFNPIHKYGVNNFLSDAKAAGIDGLIVVDLPPEEDDALCLPARAAGIDFIRLATPTTDAKRLPAILTNAGGFLYHVSVTGVTGTGSARAGALEAAMTDLKAQTDLPVAIGFGIKTPDQAAEAARLADAVVVGSAIVNRMAEPGANIDGITAFVRSLSSAVHAAREV